ncbi:hypothetical protein BCR34DRAFT_577506 [Clohesyomyces aquaticus]|uniref:Uncharacterized protein n=1 Tax=Clohesyomyces aquaticus TaxID=1231657 RepID=A0A1Y1YJQ3_9PLEO|nr:hypothetical protein BCR34DRAFT_577506 [Clohesyomyces aquaticus]
MNPQTQSPLFSRLPAEIRNAIFSLVLQEFDIPDKPYPHDTYYTRYDVRAPQTVDLRLLRTCKRAYSEARGFVLSKSVALFYAGDIGRAPKGYPGYIQLGDAKVIYWGVLEQRRNKSFEARHWERVKYAHIFIQLYAFSDPTFQYIFARETLRPGFKPKEVKITIRYTDWWYWEDNRTHVLELDGRGGNQSRFLASGFPASAERVVMEFETMEKKAAEVDAVVKKIVDTPENWRFLRADGVVMVPKIAGEGEETVREWRWLGPTGFQVGTPGYKMKMARFDHHPKGHEMGYVVKVLTWVPGGHLSDTRAGENGQ